jgi:hypothetical protein
VKLPAEVDCIRTAVALTEGALTAAALEVRAGVDPARLRTEVNGLVHADRKQGGFGRGKKRRKRHQDQQNHDVIEQHRHPRIIAAT